ncbi:MAG: hypothetical protein LUH20_09280 [Lachnospiraceae bacterium]|nr:hypothetical protein [Lachnospiraceae bacterium]
MRLESQRGRPAALVVSQRGRPAAIAVGRPVWETCGACGQKASCGGTCGDRVEDAAAGNAAKARAVGKYTW